MLPKSYLIFKWIVYALATLLLCALHTFLFSHIRVLGLTPFLYPMLPAVVSMLEGPRHGPVFALIFGAACGLLLPAPFPGFFALIFPVIALISASIAENFLSSHLLCALIVSSLALLLTGGFRILVRLLSGGGYLTLMAWITLEETLLTLPLLIVVLPLYRAIHRRCAVDY